VNLTTHSHQQTSHPEEKINKETSELNNIIDQMDITEIYRIFHPTAAEYTFFSTAHRTFSKIDHILGDKAVLTNTRKLK
jgi:exonuclease III